MPEPEDVARWEALGVDSSRIHVSGSIKFDDSAAVLRPVEDFRPLLQKIGVSESTPILLGGSTHAGEEALLAQVAGRIRATRPDLFLILAPRHMERAGALRAELEAAGYSVGLRSEMESIPKQPDILLVDTTGELRDWYGCATVVFMGKSLASAGGQNPAEAIIARKPVLFGPRMGNFAMLVRGLLQARGAIEVRNADELEAQTLRLLNDPKECDRLAAAGRAVLARHHGAAQRTAEILASLTA